jgi:chorismate mutase
MMTLVDIKEQIESIDQQIINLLEERTHACSGQNLSSDEEVEMLSLWLEEAAEKGLDDARMEKIAKFVIAMCRDASE